MKRVWIALISLCAALAVHAQERTPMPPGAAERVAIEKMMVASKAAVESKITPGAPYSAEATNESTQVLADGNRIVQKSVTRVYRDAEGRTRREELTENGDLASVTIVDPIAHVSYVLDPRTRTAYEGSILIATPRVFTGGVPESEADKRATEIAATKMKAAREEMLAREGPEPVARGRGGRGAPPPPPPPPPPGYKGDVMGHAAETSKEDLGRQAVEGITATGSRTTWTIPAGAIGNLQPIKIVSEQWFSPDLQLLVLTKHSDPRTGENVYRLQNIVRAEPDRSLFAVPPDYTVKESGIRKE
jgi:hypothetical protein